MLSTEDAAITPASRWECSPQLCCQEEPSAATWVMPLHLHHESCALEVPAGGRDLGPLGAQGWDPGPERCCEPVLGLLLQRGSSNTPPGLYCCQAVLQSMQCSVREGLCPP